jgi:hypothetical protein
MPFATSHFVTSGRFELVRVLGKGAGGTVYLARDLVLNREVAVKEAIPGAQGFDVARQKFQQEARIQARFDHPNIIKVYTVEEDPVSGEVYAFCEYARGGSLADRLERRGVLSEAEAARVGLDVCAALGLVAERQIVHRDIKPANILLVSDGADEIQCAKLADFGIAQDPQERRTTIIRTGQSHPGTPAYMPPEQYDVMRSLDVRSDLYALGATLWELLTGLDYKGLLSSGQPALQRYAPQASPAMARILAKSLQPDPSRRYQGPAELARDLQALQPRLAHETTVVPTSSMPPALARKSSIWRGWYAWAAVAALVLALGSAALLVRGAGGAVPTITVGTRVAGGSLGSVTSEPPTATLLPPTATLLSSTAAPVPPVVTLEPATATPEQATATAEPATATPEQATATAEPATATLEPPTATPVPPTATPLPPLRDVRISLAPFANDKIQNLLPGVPLGSVVFRDIGFDFGDGTTKVSTECKSYPSWPGQVTIPAGGVANVERVQLLANAGYTGSFGGQKVGAVELVFDGASAFSYDLVLGHNIREWRVELPGLVTTVGSSDTAVAFEGTTKAGDKGVIDMITITVPQELRRFPLSAIVVRDTMPGDPCFFFSGLTLRAR